MKRLHGARKSLVRVIGWLTDAQRISQLETQLADARAELAHGMGCAAAVDQLRADVRAREHELGCARDANRAAEIELRRLRDRVTELELGTPRSPHPFGMAVAGDTEPGAVVWFPAPSPRPRRIIVGQGGDVR